MVQWSSSNASAVSIDDGLINKGLLSAKAGGVATVYAFLQGIKVSTIVSVTAVTLTSITVTPTNPTIVIGTQKQFMATGTYSDNTTADITNTVTWYSSVQNRATISNATGSRGIATGVGQGSVTITASLGNVSGTTGATMSLATLTSISITPQQPNMKKGDNMQFKATGTYSDNTTKDISDIIVWSSTTPGVASISNAIFDSGWARANDVGVTTISGTANGVMASTTVTVTEN
jgi:hypothetical protein